MSELREGILAGTFMATVVCFIFFGLVINHIYKNYKVESNVPIQPELKITVINGVTDTVFIYKQKN